MDVNHSLCDADKSQERAKSMAEEAHLKRDSVSHKYNIIVCLNNNQQEALKP